MPNNPHTPFRLDDPYKDYTKHKLDNRMDPLIINWKGKIGYGDFISPVSYALNMADCNGTDSISECKIETYYFELKNVEIPEIHSTIYI